MTPVEAAAAMTYANQIDARVQVTDANADVWEDALAGVSVEQARFVIRDYYARADNGGVQGQPAITAGIVRRRARVEAERAAAKRAALEAKPSKSYDAALSTWRSRNPEEWDALVRGGIHDQWSKWDRAGETDRPCRCGCGSAPTTSTARP